DVGWTALDIVPGIQMNRLSSRLYLWDLPSVLTAPGMTLHTNVTGNVLNVTADGTIALDLEVHLQVGAVDNRVVWARELAPTGRESPFTFHADGVAFPFPVAKPAVSKSLAETSDLNDAARSAHVQVIKLLQAYAKNHGNTVPDTPS